MVRLVMGFSLIITGLSVAAAIVQDLLGSYESASKAAYILGLILCGLLFAAGAVIIYMALHFERFVFGDKGADFGQLSPGTDESQADGAKNIIVTDRFLAAFDIKAANAMTVVRTDDIIACFEYPVWDEEADMKSYTLTLYDLTFRSFTLKQKGDKMKTLHALRVDLISRMPWMFTEDKRAFAEEISDRKGRRRILDELMERQKAGAASQSDLSEGGGSEEAPDESQDSES